MQPTQDIQNLFDNLQQHKVLIIGDVMIDSYLFGSVDRISPEAPVPVVNVRGRDQRLGGAANVALNIKAMNATPILCSVVGKDSSADVFFKLLQKRELNAQSIIQSKDRMTTTKHRIMGNTVQMLRVDEEDTKVLNKADKERFLETIQHILETENIGAIIFQDYDKGVLSHDVIQAVIAMAGDIPIAVDPKYKNFHAYGGCTLFKPNLKELREGAKVHDFKLDKNFEQLKYTIKELMQNMQCQYIFTTLSEHGVLISEQKTGSKEITHQHIPAHVRHIADVSGAGDTVISLTALCLASNLSAYETAYLSNLAGGLVCESPGVVPIDKTLLEKELQKHWSAFKQV